MKKTLCGGKIGGLGTNAWDAETMKTGTIYDVYFESRIATRVIYLSRMDFVNWHFTCKYRSAYVRSDDEAVFKCARPWRGNLESGLSRI